MKHGRYPYRGVSQGLKDFDDSLCVASVYPSTRIGDILHRFSVSGILPHVGRAVIPADLVCGGDDFNSLRAKIDELRAQGVTLEQIEEMINNGNVGDNANPADSEHRLEGGLEPAPNNQGQQPAVNGQGASPATV